MTLGIFRDAFKGVAFGLVLLQASVAAAEVNVTPKHLMILRQGLDSVFGNYVFAVQNSGEAEERLQTRVMLPKETVDFVPQEGLEPNEVTLADDGGLVVDKMIPTGVHIVSIGFKADGRYGRAKLTLRPTADIQSFTLLIPRDSGLAVQSDVLVEGDASSAPDPQYRPMVSRALLPADTAFEIHVSGLPEGRGRLWMVGAAVAALLLAGVAFLAIKTRPRITEDERGGQILVG